MTGKSHILCGVATVGTTVSVGHFLLRWNNVPLKKEIVPIVEKVSDFMFQSNFLDFPRWFTYSLCAFLFVLGLLIPDIDTKESLLGRFIHIPVPHRTITHAIWIPLALGIISIWLPVFFWLAFGWFLHLFADAFSMSGICYLWPLTTYKHFTAYGKRARHHIFRLYHTGNLSEYIVVTVWCVISLITVWIEFDLFTVIKGLIG